MMKMTQAKKTTEIISFSDYPERATFKTNFLKIPELCVFSAVTSRVVINWYDSVMMNDTRESDNIELRLA